MSIKFTEQGALPPGIHWLTVEEVESCFTWNERRKEIFQGFRALIEVLARVGCRAVYLDGSYVTSKEKPNDFDLCWDTKGVKFELLEKETPNLLPIDAAGRDALFKAYQGDIRPADFEPLEAETSYLEFFQVDRDGNRKGIVGVEL